MTLPLRCVALLGSWGSRCLLVTSALRDGCAETCVLEQSIMGRVAFLYKGMGDISKGNEFESQV